MEGAPELIAEVAASSATNDLYDKKWVYRRNGVKEYIVWQVFDNKLDWFVLENGWHLKHIKNLFNSYHNILKLNILWYLCSKLL
jgi:Uma2 family endonuclease